MRNVQLFELTWIGRWEHTNAPQYVLHNRPNPKDLTQSIEIGSKNKVAMNNLRFECDTHAKHLKVHLYLSNIKRFRLVCRRASHNKLSHQEQLGIFFGADTLFHFQSWLILASDLR